MTTTATPGLVMTVAGPQDLGDVLAVLDAAAAWLTERGIKQWPEKFEGRRVEKLSEEIARGNTYLVRQDGVPVATATYTDWADPEFAPGWPGGPDGALYVVRLATIPQARALTGLSMGALMLEHARFVAEMRRAFSVRLDCSKTNTALHAYYERNGFVRVGTVDLPHRKSGALFERRTGR